MERRFVIQFHETPEGDHYDFMLDTGGVLATWRIDRLPRPGAGPMRARSLPDHRRAYLSYEGPLGGGRGSVRIAAAGTCRLTCRAPDAWRFRLDAGELTGEYRLRRTQGDWWELSGPD